MNPLLQNVKNTVLQPFSSIFGSSSTPAKPATQTTMPFYPTPTGAAPTVPNMTYASSLPPITVPKATTPAPTAPKPSSFNQDVYNQQLALNAKGAGLKLDGIMGPLTQAAISKYGNTTSNGQNINYNTGGTSDSYIPPPTYATPTTPTRPDLSAYEKAVSDAEKAYSSAGQMTPEETAAQQELDNLSASFKTGYQGASDQVIPMSFITGQQQSLEKRALNLAEPLNAKLARLQAKRTSALEASKFALDRADAKLKSEKDKNSAVKLSAGESIGQWDPTTGTFKSSYTAPTKTTDSSPASIQEYEYAKGQGYKGTFDDFKNNKNTGATQSSYQAERAARTIQSVDELLPQVNKWTTGVGSFLSAVPGSDAKYFRSQVDTLIANITYGELTAMREASKTGGALGQVSDKEGALLGAALGALSDRAITPEQYKIQLQKVKDSIQRWQNALSGSSNSGGSTVNTVYGPINTNW